MHATLTTPGPESAVFNIHALQVSVCGDVRTDPLSLTQVEWAQFFTLWVPRAGALEGLPHINPPANDLPVNFPTTLARYRAVMARPTPPTATAGPQLPHPVAPAAGPDMAPHPAAPALPPRPATSAPADTPRQSESEDQEATPDDAQGIAAPRPLQVTSPADYPGLTRSNYIIMSNTHLVALP